MPQKSEKTLEIEGLSRKCEVPRLSMEEGELGTAFRAGQTDTVSLDSTLRDSVGDFLSRTTVSLYKTCRLLCAFCSSISICHINILSHTFQ